MKSNHLRLLFCFGLLLVLPAYCAGDSGDDTADKLHESILLRPLGLVPHDHLPRYRRIVITEDNAVVVESDGTWSVPECRDEWRQDNWNKSPAARLRARWPSRGAL